MNQPIILNEENKKRAAFKRFSQMSAAGLAIASVSAFTHLSAQQLPALVEKETANNQNLPTEIFESNLTDDTGFMMYMIDGYYPNYTNNYSNAYGNSHYSNYCETV